MKWALSSCKVGLELDKIYPVIVRYHGCSHSKFPTVMASIKKSLSDKWAIDLPLPTTPPHKKQNPNPFLLPTPISRRSALLFSCVVPLTLIPITPPSTARERRGRRTIPPEDYITTSDGLKYYDLEEGKGPVAEKGSTVQVHFECLYRGITAISSRESKLLAGNRSIAQPYEFTVGAPPGKERKREYVDNPNGLFSAQASPKPPAAMYKITEGMKVGGKRTVIVPPEAGYGKKGMNEIPPGATFELNIELLQVAPTSAK